MDAMSERILLLDLGNSRLKWAISDGESWRAGEPIAHTRSGLGDLAGLFEAASGIRQARLCSTAHTLTAGLVADLQDRAGIQTRRFQPPKEALGIRSAYDQPETLGADRFLAMVGARAQVGEAFLIVDAGTALTLDMVDEDGQHIGGLIVPGPVLMREALHRGTAGVRSEGIPRLHEFARNTTDAVWSGACLAAVALVEHTHRKATLGVGAHVELILTGGAMPALVQHLPSPHRSVPDLVLRGLAVWAAQDA
jgi:type III pantothenate kinase